MRNTASRGVSVFGRASGLTSSVDLLDRTNLHGAGMRLKTFSTSECCNCRRKLVQSCVRKLLNGNHLHKIVRRKSAAQTGSSHCGQDVTRPVGVIAGRFRSARTEENGPCVFDLRQQLRMVQAEMLRSKVIRVRNCAV